MKEYFPPRKTFTGLKRHLSLRQCQTLSGVAPRGQRSAPQTQQPRHDPRRQPINTAAALGQPHLKRGVACLLLGDPATVTVAASKLRSRLTALFSAPGAEAENREEVGFLNVIPVVICQPRKCCAKVPISQPVNIFICKNLREAVDLAHCLQPPSKTLLCRTFYMKAIKTFRDVGGRQETPGWRLFTKRLLFVTSPWVTVP